MNRIELTPNEINDASFNWLTTYKGRNQSKVQKTEINLTRVQHSAASDLRYAVCMQNRVFFLAGHFN